jgi:hypothetical protein
VWYSCVGVRTIIELLVVMSGAGLLLRATDDMSIVSHTLAACLVLHTEHVVYHLAVSAQTQTMLQQQPPLGVPSKVWRRCCCWTSGTTRNGASSSSSWLMRRPWLMTACVTLVIKTGLVAAVDVSMYTLWCGAATPTMSSAPSPPSRWTLEAMRG